MSSIFTSSTKSALATGAGPTKLKRSRSHRSSYISVTPVYFESAREAMQTSHKQVVQSKTSASHVKNDIDNVQPEIALSLLYNDKTSSLTVTVLCITNLEKQLSENQNISVQAVLRPKCHQKQETRAVPSTKAEFYECFHFGQVGVSDLPTSHLQLTVTKTPGNKRVAELFLTLASIKIEIGKTLHFRFPLIMEPRSKKVRMKIFFKRSRILCDVLL